MAGEPERHPAHAEIIVIGGRDFVVRLTHQLAIDIEAAFGPLGPLVRRIDSVDFRLADFERLYALCCPGAAPDAIRAHLMDKGVAHHARVLGRLLTGFFVGCEAWEQFVAAERRIVGDKSPENPSPAA